MPILVNLPDGSKASFPDGTPPEAMKAAIQKRFPPQEAPKMDAQAFGQHLMTGEQSQNIERVNPQRSRLPGVLGQFDETSRALQNGMGDVLTLGFGDEIMAGMRALPGLVDGRGYGPAYDEALNGTRKVMADTAALNPAANITGQVAGAIVNPLGRGKPTTSMVQRGFQQGAIQGGLYGAGSADGDMQDRARGALIGGGTGAAFGVALPWAAKKAGDAVERVAQSRATSQAIKNAPSAADLKAESGKLFQAVDQSGVTVDTPKFSQFVQNIVSQAKKDRINPNLDPKATAAYEELIGALDDVQKNGGSLTISDLHTLRQVAQRAAVSSEGRDAMFANRIVDGLDNFVSQSGNMRLPPNRLGSGAPAGGNELLKAISTWSRSRRVGMIEEAVYRAQNTASGFENGLRIEFRRLLQNKKTRALFTKAEIQEIEKVANGTAASNALRLIGTLGFDLGGRNGLGGVAGLLTGNAMGGPLGALAVGAVGFAGRKGGQALTRRAADRAARVVATPNIPQVTINNPFVRLPGAALAPPVIDEIQRRQINGAR
jgi:hypothetical protein